MRRAPTLLLIASLLGVVAATRATAAPSLAQARAVHPVVISGSKVPQLHGVPVRDIVAFRWSNRWVQIPMQVDQRKVVELNTVYGQPANTTNPVNVTVYADAKTHVGAGSGVLGSLDLISFMARDTGGTVPASFSEPAAVVHNSGVRLKVVDPLTSATGYVHLFRRSGTTLSPGAGKRYVTYTFNLLSGDYKTTYRFTDGPNPENTVISSPWYQRHFGDRWQDDQIIIKAGSATRVDIVDRHKALFAPGVCGRSEDTFNDAEGAFIANISGPVRAIRSYIGANSGPYTQRTHVFYERREDINTDLRVHAIPSIMDFWDYSPQASGMRYTNDHNLTGVVVDGVPDSVASGAPQWEKVDGAQGSLTHVPRITVDFSPMTRTNYYHDDATEPNPVTQCTGDAWSYGASGTHITSSVPNTDPHLGAAKKLQARETLFFDPPNQAVATPQNRSRQMNTTLQVTATRYRP
jgi:hypothetical protein